MSHIIRGPIYGNLSAGNYSTFEGDGTPVSYGDASCWDDERVPVTATQAGGTKDPGFALFLKNTGGSSQGVFLHWFDASAEEELYFTLQIPHSWEEGTTIYPHVHWVPKSNGSAGQKVCWGLEYTWANRSAVFGNTTIIYGDTSIPDETLISNKQYLTRINGTDGILAVGYEISSTLIGRIFRDATGSGGTDSYTADAGLLELDFHILKNTNGSRSEVTK